MKEPSYAIIGMNRFGRKLTSLLAATGSQILIVDQDSDIINRYADYATYAVCLDPSNPHALQEIGLEHIDIAVVDLENNLEAAIMSVMAAGEMGVKRIIATATTNRTAEILRRIGAEEVIIPQDESAVRLAKRLISEGFLEYYDLGGNLCVIKIHPKKEWVGKKIRELRLKEKYRVAVVALETNGEMKNEFTSDTVIREDSMMALSLKKSQIYDFV
ncbi:MAG: TrkA family potassium uptake protein [Lachnospiraceae bacterium]|nr:TrkA family potassium uptake protein [Lachnospiraceae bacterium]